MTITDHIGMVRMYAHRRWTASGYTSNEDDWQDLMLYLLQHDPRVEWLTGTTGKGWPLYCWLAVRHAMYAIREKGKRRWDIYMDCCSKGLNMYGGVTGIHTLVSTTKQEDSILEKVDQERLIDQLCATKTPYDGSILKHVLYDGMSMREASMLHGAGDGYRFSNRVRKLIKDDI